jgi:hypothetical protein
VDPAKVTLHVRSTRREKRSSVIDLKNGETRRKTNQVKQQSSSVSMIKCHISKGRLGDVETAMVGGPTPGVYESRGASSMGARNGAIPAMVYSELPARLGLDGRGLGSQAHRPAGVEKSQVVATGVRGFLLRGSFHGLGNLAVAHNIWTRGAPGHALHRTPSILTAGCSASLCDNNARCNWTTRCPGNSSACT